MKKVYVLIFVAILLLLSVQNLMAQELQNKAGAMVNQIIAVHSTNSTQMTTKSPLKGNTTTKSMYSLSSTYTSPPILSGTTVIAPGDSAILTFNVGNTSSPFTLKYATSGGDTVVISGLNNGSTFKVSPSVTTSYKVISVTDSNDSVSDGNLIVNPSGDLGLTIWTFTSAGGGWTTESSSSGSNFATSYVSEYKSQTIDLVANGYSTTELDAQPYIYVSDDYSTRNDQGGNYGVLTQLRNSSQTSVTSWSNPSAYTTPGSPSYNTLAAGVSWKTTINTFSNYGTGVRNIYFEDAGHDVSSWAGFYGTKMRNSTVIVEPVVKVVPPCTSPANQPTGLTLNPSGATITGSFIASAGTPSADHYLIVRNTINSLTALPVTGTTYTAGSTFGGGTVVAFQTGTTITDNGPFTAGSKYYYFVFAANALCSNGPMYNTSSPLKDSITIVSHDVYVSNVISPADTVTVNSTQTVSVRVKNSGISTETTFLMGYQRNSMTPVLENWTGTLLPGDSMTYSFLTTFVATPATAFTFCAYTKLTTDQDTANDKMCKTVHFPSSIGINENNALSDYIEIYPNPTKDNLTVETNSNTEQKLEILNLIGQTVYRSVITKKAVVKTDEFLCGVYFIKLSTDKETVVRKFVKE